MHPASGPAGEREDSAADERKVLKDAQALVIAHGEDAERVAARRADSLFRKGDLLGGTRWLKIFRRIAFAHRRSTD